MFPTGFNSGWFPRKRHNLLALLLHGSSPLGEGQLLQILSNHCPHNIYCYTQVYKNHKLEQILVNTSSIPSRLFIITLTPLYKRNYFRGKNWQWKSSYSYNMLVCIDLNIGMLSTVLWSEACTTSRHQ